LGKKVLKKEKKAVSVHIFLTYLNLQKKIYNPLLSLKKMFFKGFTPDFGGGGGWGKN